MEKAVGSIDAAAQLPSGAGWLLFGWTPRRWSQVELPEQLYATLSLGTVTGEAHSAFFDRADAPPGASGFCTLLSGPSPPSSVLHGIEVPHLALQLTWAMRDRVSNAIELGRTCRSFVRRSLESGGCEVLRRLPRPTYDGTDGLGALWPPVHLEFDQAIRVPPDGLALTGWLVDPARAIVALTICGAATRVELPRDRWITLRRPDLLGQYGALYGLDDDRFGLLAYAAGVGSGTAHIEIETVEGDIAYKPLRVLELTGLGAIKQFLAIPRPSSHALQWTFDEVLGPIVQGLNAKRLARPCDQIERVFGERQHAPRISVIVTIYHQLEFMAYQLALFSERNDAAVELIYVIDDPRLGDRAETLAHSCWARFGLPFRLIMLSENLGYAPANNIGLRAAAGTFACLLNSDVFPLGDSGLSWLEPLVATLERDRTLGVVGPMLVYEDGTIQHRGMHYARLPGLAEWAFPIHTDKGRPPPAEATLSPAPAITGACMVFRRDEVLAMGGLDERFLIGDFEDADLCERFRIEGLRCAVDTSQRLLHLERQSQGGTEAWRANTTLLNAWRFNQRWSPPCDGD